MFRPALTSLGVAVTPIPFSSAGLPIDLPVLDCSVFAAARGLARLMYRRKPDVVHGWMDELGAAGALAGVLCGVRKVVIDLRGFNPSWSDTRGVGTIRSAFRVLSRCTTVSFVANSEAAAKDYAEWANIPTARIQVIYNGIDAASLGALPGDVRDFRNFVSAVIDRKAYDKISKYLGLAKKGAKILQGGNVRRPQ
ncbi:MAG: glycosyltransferase, partial [Gammaproteobacteria bacterium]|nr:glycosyltransferase [Gammaproteobacteria bacterium]